MEVVQILCTPLAPFPFTFKPIGSIISHHDILQLIGSLMLRSARIERKTQVGVARTSQGPAL